MTRAVVGSRMIQKDFPPWQTISFRRFVRLILLLMMYNIALMHDRERAGRKTRPSAGIITNYTVKAPAPGAERGYGAAKKMIGRKRHHAIDTDGRGLMVNLRPVDISDSIGAQMILEAIRSRWPWFTPLFAYGAYDRRQLLDKAAFVDLPIEVVRRIDITAGVKARPRRWVERTFRWLTRRRRLVRDYERLIDVPEAMIIQVAMSSFLMRRISH